MGHALGGGIVSHPGIYTANRSEGGPGGKSATLINGTISQFYQSAAFSDWRDENSAGCIITLGRLGVAARYWSLAVTLASRDGRNVLLQMIARCCWVGE